MLYLKSLKLKNFMNFSKAEFDFNSNIILISGANGNGKSAIFEAIALCLTSKKRSVSYQDYVKQGTEQAEIKLDCLINKKSVFFDVKINLVKGTTFQIDLHYDGNIYQNKETEEIIKSFGLDYYSDLIFTMQHDDDITKLTPAQRAYYLQKLLNFDFEEQKIKLKKDIDSFEEIIKKNNIEIPLKQNSIKREQESIETLKEIKESAEEIFNLQALIELKERELEQAEKDSELKENSLKEINILQTSINNSSNKINELNLQIKHIEEAKEKNEKLKAELSHIEDMKKTDSIVLANLRNEIEKQEQLSKEIQNEIDDLALNKLHLIAIKHEIEKLEQLYEQDNCPVCGQQTKEAAEQQYVNYLAKIDNSFLKNESLLECKSVILSKISEFENSLKLKETEKESLLKGIEHNKKIEKNTELTLIKYTANIENLGSQIIKSIDTSKITSIKNDLSAENNILNMLTKKKDSLQEELNKLPIIKTSEIRTELNIAKNKMTDYHNRINANKEIEIRNIKRNENIVDIQKEIDNLNQMNFELMKQKETYEEAYKIFDKDLPNFMSIKSCALLQDEQNSIIQNIFPTYEVYLEANKKGVEYYYTKDNTIQAGSKKNNNLLNAKMSSGFEKVLLTLAFKISLAKLYNCDCLFLDEADKSADEENTQILYEYLLNMGNYNQIFLITHKQIIKDLVINNYQAKVYEIENGEIV